MVSPAESKVFNEWNSDCSKLEVLLEEEDFHKYIEESKNNKVLIVKFFATWCAPCQKIHPFVEKLCSTKNANKNIMKFLEVDVDEFEDIAQFCKVSAMPTFLLFINGTKVSEIVGAEKQALEDLVMKN